MTRIGIVGFGEVGSCLGAGLRAAGAEVTAYDSCWNVEPAAARVRRRSEETGIPLAADPCALAAQADCVIAVTVPTAALEAARGVAPGLRPGQFYADFNSAVPAVKREIERLVQAQGGQFVDGGILGSPRTSGHRVPVVVSGRQAAAFAAAMNRLGMRCTPIGTEAGQASALKVIRSVFTKGFEAVLLECLVAAEAFGIRDAIRRSLAEFLAGQSPDALFELLMTTHAVHAGRRAGEMDGVLALLRGTGIDAAMTDATARKLRWSAALDIMGKSGGEPANLAEVIRLVTMLSGATAPGAEGAA